MQVICDIVPVLGSDVTNNILSAVSPLLTSTDLDKRFYICDLLDALARADPSIQFVVICQHCSSFSSQHFVMLLLSLFSDDFAECRQNLSRT